MTVNNTIDNAGSIEGGDFVGIDFMNNSVNNLTQYAYAFCRAAVATTTENGSLTKNVNNKINVKSMPEENRMSFNKHDLSRNACMLTGSFRKKGYDSGC